jgi:hypothetical protein
MGFTNYTRKAFVLDAASFAFYSESLAKDKENFFALLYLGHIKKTYF